jgi:hypothetical protein
MENIQPFDFNFELGRIPRESQPTDFPASVLLGQGAPVQPIWKPEDAMNLPITMQGTIPACGGFAAQYRLVHQLFKATGQYLPLGPRSSYAEDKSIDGFGKNVPGTTIQAIAKSVTAMGIALDTLFSNDITLDPSVYADYSLMSQAAIADALTRATEESYFFTGKSPSLDTLKQLIEQYDGVILEVEVGPEWYTAPNGQTSWAAADILPNGKLRPPSKNVSGHFIYCPAHDENILFPNEWSSKWGNDGWGALGQDYVPFITNGLAFKKVPVSVQQTLKSQPQITPTQISIAQRILIDIEQVLGLMQKEVAGL